MHNAASFKESLPVIPSMTTAIIPTRRRAPAKTCNHLGIGQPCRTHNTMYTNHATKTMPPITCQATEVIRDPFSYTEQLPDSVHPWGPDGSGIFDFRRLSALSCVDSSRRSLGEDGRAGYLSCLSAEASAKAGTASMDWPLTTGDPWGQAWPLVTCRFPRVKS